MTRGIRMNLQRRNTVRLPANMNAEMSGRGNDTYYGINKEEFMEIIRGYNNSMEDWASGLFDNFDEDKSGFLDFRELVICMSILSKGTFEERLRLCFDVYDVDKSGYLQRDEL